VRLYLLSFRMSLTFPLPFLSSDSRSSSSSPFYPCSTIPLHLTFYHPRTRSSHGNSSKKHENQVVVAGDVAKQLGEKATADNIMGVMVCSLSTSLLRRT
jgi:hypothetical protein